MPTLLDLAVVAVLMIATAAGTWTVQDWRWEAKQTAAIKAVLTINKAEASQAAAAATTFETDEGITHADYAKLETEINTAALAPGALTAKCLEPDSLHLVNRALTRPGTVTGGLAHKMSAIESSK